MKRFLLVFSFLITFCLSAHSQASGLADLKFGQYQIADSQWNVSACMYTVTCQIYSKNPGTAYKIPWFNGQLSWGSGDYVAFQATGDATNPWNAVQYTSGGTQKAVMGTGHIINMGTDYFFFVGNDNNTGQLFSMTSGFANTSGVTWTGTLNPTVNQVNTYATSGSTTPLSAGQTVQATAPVKTVTGTTTTYTTRNAVSGNTTTVYRTPVTTTSYSDNTTTVANGTEALYQTKVATNIVTNKIVGTTLTTYTTPVLKVTPADSGASFLESNGSQTTTTQTVQQGLTAEVFRYDPKNYNCFLGACAWNFTYHTPSTNRSSYGNPVNSFTTTNGMFFATNTNLPNNDNSLIGRNEGTVIRYTGTITAPITDSHPAGSVYRLNFYNNSDDGFRMWVNGVERINQNTTVTYQSLFGYTSSGYMDVVAGQTYNLEAWYWNTTGGLGQTLYWDHGTGMIAIYNTAFTTGTISNIDIDLTGLSYSNPTLVPTSGTAMPTLCCGGSAAPFNADSANVAKVQAFTNRTTADSQVYITQIGNQNTITVNQSGTRNNYFAYDGNGSNNTITATQTGTAATEANYIDITVNGNSNNVNILQQSTGGAKGAFVNIQDSNNSLILQQKDSGSHYADVSLTGGGKNVDILQQGSASHMAKIGLTGLPVDLSLTQTGSTQNFYSINFNCATAGGCAKITVQQGQ